LPIQPCRPVSAKTVPAGAVWLHELKLDGYRLQIIKDRREVRVFTRRGAEWTERLAAFADPFVTLACRSAILDGELALPDKTGAADFRGLHRALASSRHHELVFFAFDLLHRDGQDLMPLPLAERRRRLSRLVSRSEVPCLHLVEAFDDGAKLLATAERMRLEGIVSKRRATPIAPASAGTGARSRPSLGARRTGSGGGCLKRVRPCRMHFV
jgi:bifunctional non-homologous end joining protein LigD